MSSRYFDRDGNPITSEQWIPLIGNNKFLRDEIEDVTVSTVYLGLDHSFGGGPPLIYETMVFGTDDEHECQWRYSTKEEASLGHDKIVAAVRNKTFTRDMDVAP